MPIKFTNIYQDGTNNNTFSYQSFKLVKQIGGQCKLTALANSENFIFSANHKKSSEYFSRVKKEKSLRKSFQGEVLEYRNLMNLAKSRGFQVEMRKPT